jgi:hypothetical protein
MQAACDRADADVLSKDAELNTLKGQMQAAEQRKYEALQALGGEATNVVNGLNTQLASAQRERDQVIRARSGLQRQLSEVQTDRDELFNGQFVNNSSTAEIGGLKQTIGVLQQQIQDNNSRHDRNLQEQLGLKDSHRRLQGRICRLGNSVGYRCFAATVRGCSTPISFEGARSREFAGMEGFDTSGRSFRSSKYCPIAPGRINSTSKSRGPSQYSCQDDRRAEKAAG